MKANDRQKETWPCFLQRKGFQAATTILLFLQPDADVCLFGFQSSQLLQTWLLHVESFFPPIPTALCHFNPCVICTGQATSYCPGSLSPSQWDSDLYRKLHITITQDKI